MKNILLIVGGTGFIGLSILNYLNKKNNKFKKIITISTSNSKLEILKKFNNLKIQHISKKIIKLKSLPKCDNIMYLALSKKSQADVKNFKHFINLLEMSEFKGKILYTSSGAVNKYLDNKKNKKFSYKDYAIAKIKNENLLRKITSKNIKSSIARCYTFVGKFIPLNSNFVIGNIISSILNKKSIILKNSKKVVRSYMHTDELSRSLINILYKSNKNCPTFNVGSLDKIIIKKLCYKLSKKYGVNLETPKYTSNYEDIYLPNRLKKIPTINAKMTSYESVVKTINELK